MDTGTLQARVLAHIGLYSLTTVKAVARVFFDDREDSSRGVIRTLREKKLIESHDLAAGSYYQLTPEGVKALHHIGNDIPRGRATKLGSEQSLQKHLHILCYCALGTPRRHRLEPGEVRSLLGDAAGTALQGANLCVEETGERPTLVQTYVPAGGTKAAQVLVKLENVHSEGRRDATICSWMDGGHLQMRVLIGEGYNDEGQLRQELKRRDLESWARVERTGAPLVRLMHR